MEFATLTRSEDGAVKYNVLEAPEIDALIASADLTAEDEAS